MLKKLLIFVFIASIACIGEVFGQTGEESTKRKNFPQFQNPKTKAKPAEKKPETVPEGNPENNEAADFQSRSVASKTLEIARKATSAAVSPTDIYRVGPGDVLFINLPDAPAGGSTYYTVLNDGTIEFPLAGGMIPVGGKTTDEIEELLKEKIKLLENPQLNVRVRDHSSHRISVFGLVEKAGEKYLQREAVPLFVVRAEAVVQPKANRVTVRRKNAEIESFDLGEATSENILIFPGDIVEFSYYESSSEKSTVPQFYYIGGEVRSVGQKDFIPGITLTQAILASGGLVKSKVKKVIIRRKNSEGLLEPAEFDLKLIKNGKIPDPLLEAGDTIEVGN